MLVGFQAWLGRETVRLNNAGDSVTAHLAAAMALLGVLVFVTVAVVLPGPARRPAAPRSGSRCSRCSRRATMFGLLLFGSNVTAQDAGLVFPDWPLMNGALIPLAGVTDPQVLGLYEAHVLHRYVAAVVLILVWATAIAAWRTQRARAAVVNLALAMAVIYPIQVGIGALQVVTRLADWTQTLHVALSAVLWGLAVALTVAAYCEARLAAVATQGVSVGRRVGRPATTAVAGAAAGVRPRRRRSAPTSP